jgi:hypothetical protein
MRLFFMTRGAFNRLIEFYPAYDTFDGMSTILNNVLSEVERLPDADQQELATQIEDMIITRKIAASEADIAAGRVVPLNEAFAGITSRLKAKHGNGSPT